MVAAGAAVVAGVVVDMVADGAAADGAVVTAEAGVMEAAIE